MDTPHVAAQPGPGAKWSAAEQQLIEYAQFKDLRDATSSDLAALAELRARLALQVSPVPAWVRIQVEIEPPPTADTEPADATVDTQPATQDQLSTEATPPADATAPELVPLPHESVVAVDTAARARCRMEADLIEAAAEVVGECRARILDRRGLTGVALSPAAERSVDAAVRQAAVMELELATGTSTAEAQTLLAVATCGGELRSMLLAALRRGQARWVQVKTFWERTTRAHLTHDQRLLVAYVLFGTDPALACEERFDIDGHLDLDRHWAHHPYLAALAREIAACLGQHPEADTARRRRAYENRRVEICLHDDGSATLTMTGPAVMIAGIRHRLDTAARALIAAGEERSLSQLRFDIAAALALHGILDLADTDADTLDEVLTPERLVDLLAVIHAQPKVHAQIIVPVDALRTGLPLCPACAEKIQPTQSDSGRPTGDDAGQDTTGHRAGATSDDDHAEATDLSDHLDAEHPNPATPWEQAARGSTSPPPWASPPDQPSGQSLPDEAPPDTDTDPAAVSDPACLSGRRDSAAPFLDREPPGRGLVGELIGSHPMFLTPGHARELVLLPGTTLHRLLTDPADGRLIERTLITYRPDTDMRRQVLAADLYSRAPGSRLTGRTLELDHVIPWGTPGGTTTETNLAALSKRAHHEKTLGHWRIEMGTRRDLTVTTLLNQHRTTRVHDYGQYLRTAEPDDLAARRDLASQAIYAHETQHQRTLYLAGDRAALRDEAWVRITHTDPRTGRTHDGPHPDTPTVEDLLNIPGEDASRDGTGTGDTPDGSGTGDTPDGSGTGDTE